MPRCEMCGEWPYCPWQTDPDVICSKYHQKPLTNADRIRAMSDEELAEWFASKYNDCDLCPDYIYAGDCPDGCKKKWLDWLRQEADI